MSELKTCPCCNKKPTAYSRYLNSILLYSWYQCEGTPPCYVGTCHNPTEEDMENKMKEGWNKACQD